MQMSNEVKAARSLPNCSSLGHQVAWQEAQDGSMISLSLYAGPTVEALLQHPVDQGGWSGLTLQQRVEVARDVLAGGVHALIKMRPWLHFDVKPANVAVMACPASGPLHITLLDMGAATHIAALHAPQRNTLYPVVSKDHMDVALMTRQPGQNQLPFESKQGAREALSDKTDIFTLGLLAYKILLGPQLPAEMDWNSTLYEPWDEHQELHYMIAQQRLASDLAAGCSSHASTTTMLQQLPHDCLFALGRMCDPEPITRAILQEASSLPFIKHCMDQLGLVAAARDAAYASARQQLINKLQNIQGIILAARPSRTNSTGDSARVSNSSSICAQVVAEAPPGAFQRLPRGTNAAQEAAAAAAAACGCTHFNGAPPQMQQHGNGPPGFARRQGEAAQHEENAGPGPGSIWVPQLNTVTQLDASSLCTTLDQSRQYGKQQDAFDVFDDQTRSNGPPGFHLQQCSQSTTANKPPGAFLPRVLAQHRQLPVGSPAPYCPPGFQQCHRQQHQKEANHQPQHHHHQCHHPETQQQVLGSCPPGFDAQQARDNHGKRTHQQEKNLSIQHQHQLSEECPPPGSWPRKPHQPATNADTSRGHGPGLSMTAA